MTESTPGPVHAISSRPHLGPYSGVNGDPNIDDVQHKQVATKTTLLPSTYRSISLKLVHALYFFRVQNLRAQSDLLPGDRFVRHEQK